MKTKLSLPFFATIFYILYSTTISAMNIEVNIQDTSDLDPSAVWYSSVGNGGNWPDCKYVLNIISVQREEEIGGRTSQIIGVTHDGLYYPESELALYRENKKMYFYEDNIWKLLYDFSAMTGDTVHYFLSKKINYYLKPYGINLDIDFMIPDTSLSLVVNKVDTVITNSGLPIKRFRCTDVSGYMIDHEMDIIYENIGSKDGLFGMIGSFITEGCVPNSHINCYLESGQTFSFVDHDCATLVATDDFDSKENLQIRPNPTNGSLTIVGLKEAVTVNVYDLNGVLHKSLKNIQSSIDISELPIGMYLAQIDFGTIRKTFKIVKME